VYSDRIHHALAFAAKHYPSRISRYDSQSGLIRASSVAVILARHHADELTITTGILKPLVDACPHPRLESLAREILAKFGAGVAIGVQAAAEPRFDALGRERQWKACRLEYLARLTSAPPPSLDACIADEIHRLGAALVSVRRLGVEYLETAGVPHPADTLWWLETFGETMQTHPRWRRPELLAEYQRLAIDLRQRLAEAGGGPP
jgi:hypothetical protein